MQQQKPLTLRRNFSWSFIGNVVYAACQWGMLVVLSKIGSPEIVGQFTLGLAITAPVLIFTNLQLREIQATDAKQQYVFSDYLGLRLLSTGLALLVIVAITLKAGYSVETSLVILLVGLAKAFESISDVFYGLFQQYERMDRIAVSMMIKGPLSLLLLGIGVYLTGSVVGGTVGLAVAWALVLFGYDLRSGAWMLNQSLLMLESKEPRERKLRVTLQPRWHLRTLGKLVWLSLPLGFVMMLGSLNVNIPRYFIERYLGERELGIFAAIAYLMVAGNMVVYALGSSAISRLAKYYSTGNSAAFRTLLLKLVGIAAVLGGGAILVALVAGRELLTLVYKPEYAQHTDLLVWLMVTAAIGYMSSFLGDGLVAARYLRIQIPLFVLVTATSAIGSYWLIPIDGLRGAAIALLFAAIIQVVLRVGVIVYALHKLQRHSTRNSEPSVS
jgi:O-antigen/teichoic acid export membrane protein